VHLPVPLSSDPFWPHAYRQAREAPYPEAFGLDEKSEETVIGVRDG
jgi:hypothetical protein